MTKNFEAGRVYLITLETKDALGVLQRDAFSGWWTGRATSADTIELLDIGFPEKIRFARKSEIADFVPTWVE